MAFDLMGWSEMVQNAKYAMKNTSFRTQEGPTQAILEPNKAQADQSDLRVTAVLPREN